MTDSELLRAIESICGQTVLCGEAKDHYGYYIKGKYGIWYLGGGATKTQALVRSLDFLGQKRSKRLQYILLRHSGKYWHDVKKIWCGYCGLCEMDESNIWDMIEQKCPTYRMVFDIVKGDAI